MKYELSIVINKPLAEVIALFDSFENIKHWQPELVRYQHLSGEPGTVGAKTELVYQMGKKEIVMVETIEVRNLPDEFTGTYQADGVFNRLSNRFEAVDSSSTRWLFHSEFKFTGFMKFLAWMMPGAFKKQSCKIMENFKRFAEQSESIVQNI